MKRFEGRVAVITGAASGFGLELARSAAARGMRLVLADIEEAALEQAASALARGSAEVEAVPCDVSDGAQVRALADAAMARFGAVHLIFNNAGVGGGGLLWENSEADWRWILGVNLWGVVHGVRIFTPLMLECARSEADYEGHIVNTASMAGLLNAPAMGVYNVSKHAVVSLTETLHHDLRLIDAPVHASVLCPYYVPTRIAEAERNRPRELQNDGPMTPSQQAAQALAGKAVSAGRIPASQVAENTFHAIGEKRFYIHSHPAALDAVRARMEEIVTQANPADPYRDMPQIGETLRASLRPR